MKIHEISMNWMYYNYQEIQNSYAGKFIAIYNERVVASDSERENLFNALKTIYTDKEIDEIFIEYINPKGYILILSLRK